MNITLTNNEIYNYTTSLQENFINKEIKLPIKVIFYLQKNLKTLTTLAQELEEQRISIVREYGVLNEETQKVEVPAEKTQEATEKMNELFNLTQEVQIYKVNLDAFGDISLTPGQMQALLFMIDEEE